MGTRSIIAAVSDPAVVNEAGVVSTYCHYDGYPEWTGRLLKNLYNDDNSAFEIASIGYLSGLQDTMEGNLDKTKHQHKDEPVFYNSLQELFDEMDTAGSWVEYVYYWQDDEWYCVKRQDGSVTPLGCMTFTEN